jgi:hypothetical protein
MRKILLLLILLLLVFLLSSEVKAPSKPLMKKLASFPDILKPGMIIVRGGRLFVTEGATVSIYSMKDFTLIKKFGKPGEGPQEFKLDQFGGQLIIDVLPQYILVNSLGKLSYFTLNGDFIKEKRNPAAFYIQPIDENYVGMSTTFGEGNTRFRTVNLYDPDLKEIREIYRQEHEIQVQKGKGIHLLKKAFVYYVVEDKIFISGKEGFVVDIYDEQGKLLRTIERKDYKKRKVTDAEKAEIHRILKRQYKELYEYFKNTIIIAPHFPVIASIFVRDKRVYVLTNNEVDQMWEMFLYDLEGVFIKTLFVPMLKRDLLIPFPTDIRNGNVYQLIENDEDEMWELHVTGIE